MKSEIGIIEHLQLWWRRDIVTKKSDDLPLIAANKYWRTFIDETDIAEEALLALDDFNASLNFSLDDDFDISSLDYCQSPSWALIKKNLGFNNSKHSNYIEETRWRYYDNLKEYFWLAWMDEFYSLINWWVWFWEFFDFCINSGWKEVVEKICVFSLIELELIWNEWLSNSIYNYLLEIWVDYNSIRFLTYFYFSRQEFNRAYNIVLKALWTKELTEDKQMLEQAITLSALNWDEWDKDLLSSYLNIVENEYRFSTISKDDYLDDKSFYYERLIGISIKEWADIYEVIELAHLWLESWNSDSYYYLIHCYLVLENYKIASKYYSEWNLDNWDTLSFTDADDREIFYMNWLNENYPHSAKLLVDFYREEFTLNWFNDSYFNQYIDLLKDYDYKFNDDDVIFFDKFSDTVDSYDNEKGVSKILILLFWKYEKLSFILYLDKILILISKYLRWIYGENDKIKNIITFCLERITLSEELMKNELFDVELFNSEINIKKMLLEDKVVLNERFRFLLIKFARSSLDNALLQSSNVEAIKLLPDDYTSLSMSLASIFEFYGLHEDKDKALKFDSFFNERALKDIKPKVQFVELAN